jgi:Icc protein
MKIIQISDCHLFADPQKNGYNSVNPFRSLKRILDEVKVHQPGVLLVTGDITGDGSGESYQHFSKLIQESKMDCQIAIIPGNHDDQSQLKTNILNEYLWLSNPRIVLPNQWHIHLLDTQQQHTIGHISEASLTSLSKYLSLHPNDYHLIAAHHHPIPCGGWMDKHEWTNRQSFNAVVTEHKSVRAVVYGHIHMAIEQYRDQCVYLACPSTCWQFANKEYFATTDLMPGYRVINLQENGQISTSIHRLEEQI